jgi:hypothetical protein
LIRILSITKLALSGELFIRASIAVIVDVVTAFFLWSGALALAQALGSAASLPTADSPYVLNRALGFQLLGNGDLIARTLP